MVGEAISKLTKWSALAKFGNTPLAKATLFLPIVAQFVILSDSYLLTNWGMGNAIWLYWSLMFIALGQVLYFLKAPDTAKRFGGDLDSYIEKSLATWTDPDFGRVAKDYLRSFFSRWGGGPFSFLDNEQEIDRRRLVETITNITLPPQVNQTDHEQIRALGDQNVVAFHQIADNGGPFLPSNNYQSTDEAFNGALTRVNAAEIGQNDLSAAQELYNYFRIPRTDNQWKIIPLRWQFSRNDERHCRSRYLCLTLYALGSIYFIWNTLINVSKVILKTAALF